MARSWAQHWATPPEAVRAENSADTRIACQPHYGHYSEARMMVSWAVSGHAAWARNNHGLNVTDLGTQHSLSTTSGNSTEPHYTETRRA